MFALSFGANLSCTIKGLLMSDKQVFDQVILGGKVIDPATGLEGQYDIGIVGGRIVAIEKELSSATARASFNAVDRIVIPGMIDTHAHIYEHVTGKFGLNPELVGTRSGVTTVVDQGGPSCMTLGGFRNYIYNPSKTRTLCFISAYLVGGIEGHLYPDLYGPNGVNPEHTIRVAKDNLDIIKGVKAHAEIGGQSRWGLEVIKIGKDISREVGLPLYIHLGQLWPTKETAPIPDAAELIEELLPIMEEGDILAHPFTRHPGGFVNGDSEIHPILLEAVRQTGIRVDVGHGSHFSFEVARRVLNSGIMPFTLGADMHGYNVRVPGTEEDEVRQSNPFLGVAPFNLTIAMSELLHLGVTLMEVVSMVTANAACLLRMEDELGSIQVGREADISILNIETGRFKLSDNSGCEEICEHLISPLCCFRAGELVDVDSPFVPAKILA